MSNQERPAEKQEAVQHLAVISITPGGKRIADRIAEAIPGITLYHSPQKGSLRPLVQELFNDYRGMVFIMAAGIVVRMVAPLIRDKYSDPAVVVVDDAGRYAISLLSGHEGGANELAYRIAGCVGATPIITTGTETEKTVVAGLGCRRGVGEEEVVHALEAAFGENGIELSEVRTVATIAIKRDETGLLRACRSLDLPLVFCSKEAILLVGDQYERSEIAYKYLGVHGVAEPCALLTAKNGRLLQSKKTYGQVTVALVREQVYPGPEG